ncbi:MAG: 30S ribosomal protein S6--L-glutamate ligase, partial [Bacteroidetes bacterium]|nr:30S ribosomal protein S6--L-glutamate ligase [Bacteroidota bacterium]
MKIAILSRNLKLYSTRRLVEAAEQRGHEVIVLDHLKCVLVIEKGHPQIFYGGKQVVGIDAIIPRIGTSVTFYGAAVVRQFEQMKVFSSVESQALVRSRDKLRSLQLLAKAGLGMPKTAFASTPKNIENVLEQVGGAPVVIKLLEGTQGIGVILAET